MPKKGGRSHSRTLHSGPRRIAPHHRGMAHHKRLMANSKHLGQHAHCIGNGIGHHTTIRHSRSLFKSHRRARGTSSSVSPLDLMGLNQMTAPLSSSMMAVGVGDYGILGFPGATVSTTGAPTSPSSSAVMYPPEARYFKTRVHNTPTVGFDGFRAGMKQSSGSTASRDYVVWTASGQQWSPAGSSQSETERYDGREPHPAYFTIPEVSTLEPVYRQKGKDQREGGAGCCVIS